MFKNKITKATQTPLQKKLCVGREEQLEIFRKYLSQVETHGQEISDARRVLNVYGLEGVGKTFLVDQFKHIAVERQWLTAQIEKPLPSVLHLMASLADELAAKKHKLQSFTRGYDVYCREKDSQFESGINDGPAALVTKLLFHIGLSAASAAAGPASLAALAVEPVKGDVSEYIGKVGKELAHAVSKQGNPIDLLRQPERELSRLFIKDIDSVSKKHPLLLILDNYECNQDIIDPWLMDVLTDKYGELPSNLLFLVIGKSPLPIHTWREHKSIVQFIPVEPFSRAEIVQYLANHQIHEEQVIDKMLHLSAGLPLFLDMVVLSFQQNKAVLQDPSDTVIQIFLRDTEDTQNRQTALDASLLRRIDQQGIEVLTDSKTASQMFVWLSKQAFVQRQGTEWRYHPAVRKLMLRYNYQVNLHRWRCLHQKLASFYHEEQKSLGLKKEDPWANKTWRRYQLNYLYHLICADPEKNQGELVSGFLNLFRWDDFDPLYEFLEMASQAAEDCFSPEITKWVLSWQDGLRAYQSEGYSASLDLFDCMVRYDKLDFRDKSLALLHRSLVYHYKDDNENAWQDIEEAVEQNPDNYAAWFYHGLYRIQDGTKGTAFQVLDDYFKIARKYLFTPEKFCKRTDRSVGKLCVQTFLFGLVVGSPDDPNTNGLFEKLFKQLDDVLKYHPDKSMIWQMKSTLYCINNQREPALKAAERAIRYDPRNFQAWQIKAEIYKFQGNYPKALAAIEKVLEELPESAYALSIQSQVYQKMGFQTEALDVMNRAVSLDPQNADIFARRGKLLWNNNQFEEALSDLNTAIEMENRGNVDYRVRGILYQSLDRMQDALADFTFCIDRDPGDLNALMLRGELLAEIDVTEDAIHDFTRALEIAPQHKPALQGRVMAYASLNRFTEALDDLKRILTLQQEEDDALWLYYMIGALLSCYADTKEENSFLIMALDAIENAVPTLSGDDCWHAEIDRSWIAVLLGQIPLAESTWQNLSQKKIPPTDIEAYINNWRNLLNENFPNPACNDKFLRALQTVESLAKMVMSHD